jgi:RNA ligase (TIGR02306 family)
MAVAVIGMIHEILPIENAERLESAVVVCGAEGKWYGVVQKGQFEVGQLVEVFLQDALLPTTDPRFDFMARHKHLVRIQKLRGARSECLIMPLSYQTVGLVGMDIGAVLGVTKYEKPLPPSMAGQARGNFPTHLVPKTDEPNFQKVPGMVALLEDLVVAVTEKADGSSVTFYLHDGHFGVCSRNLELQEGNSTPWLLAKQYHINAALSKLPYNAALQAEAVGPGIHKGSNPMGLETVEALAFTLYNIDERRYMNHGDMVNFCAEHAIPTVECLFYGVLPGTDDDTLLQLASGNYACGKPREGVVIRPAIEMTTRRGERVSVKIINPDYK